MKTEIAVSAIGLTKKFGRITAVNSLELSIPSGTVYGLIGPNGAGKTTTIKLFMGLLRPTSGEMKVLGRHHATALKEGLVSYMPQNTALYMDLPVLENLRLFGRLYGLGTEEIENKASELLDFVELRERASSVIDNLSGGMQHRASLACALMAPSRVIFLDEPTVGVDPEIREDFWGYFRKLKDEGRTVVITTHYMDEARRCDLVGMIKGGKLIAEGTPEALMEKAGTDDMEAAFLYHSREGGQ